MPELKKDRAKKRLQQSGSSSPWADETRTVGREELEELGFKPPNLDEIEDYSCNVCIDGQEGTGKTFWACQGPDPLRLLTFDAGTERIMEQLASEERDILWQFVPLPRVLRGNREANMQRYMPIWDKVEAAMWAMIDSDARSMVVDTMTDLRTIRQLAMFGKTDKIVPELWMEINAPIRAMTLAACKRKGLCTFWIHKVGDEYKSTGSGQNRKKEKTGELEMKGDKDIRYSCDLILRTLFEPSRSKSERFGVDVWRNKRLMSMSGRTLWGDGSTFVEIMMKTFPGSKEEDWE